VKDWHHPEYPTLYTRRTRTHPDGFHGFPNPRADYMKYLAYLQGQVRELLTNYGPVGIMWFDWCGCALSEDRHRERAHQIVEMIHEIQPDCLINNRFCEIGADYGTPEQHIPREAQKAAFEVCMTLNDNWSYNRHDRNWKDPGTVVHNLVDIVGKGGNYLLGVGPTAEGVVPDEAVRILDEVGRWLRANGESIYGAGPPDQYLRWDREVDAVTAKPGRYYLHVFKWPDDRRIFLYDFRKRFRRAYLLAGASDALKADVYRRSVMIHVPTQAPDPIDSVTVVEYEEPAP
jgi:alpha-L-fucosidase